MAEPHGKAKVASTEANDIISATLPTEQSFELTEKTEYKLSLERENAELDLETRRQKKRRRERWDTTLLSLVVLGFGLSYILIIFIGGGILSFGDNVFAIPTVVAAGVLETYGLAKLAIRYFFNDDDMKNSS